jgi:putative flavoprotein involved in K+ transport
MPSLPTDVEVAVIGGGQAGLALGYFLSRTKLNYVILDDQPTAGGAWLHAWKSLKLFSPVEYSSLPGWQFPKGPEKFPTREEVILYLSTYEERYHFPIHRPVHVRGVERGTDRLILKTDNGEVAARAAVSCTGTWGSPYIPTYPGISEFNGIQIHSANYSGPDAFKGMNVLIVGGGNSGAQILAEVSKVARTTWATVNEPTYLPDDVDGRVLFQVATEQYRAHLEGRELESLPSFGDIVMIDSVKDARARGVLKSIRMFSEVTSIGAKWPESTELLFDAVIWCTGFRSALGHLDSLGIRSDDGKIEVRETRSKAEPRLWLMGYGEWTGFGSATLIGVQRYAKATVQEIERFLEKGNS